VFYRLTTRGVGNAARVDIVRGGKPGSVTLALLAPPPAGRGDVSNLAGQHPFDGARVSNILPNIADELGFEEGSGVVVLSVRPGGIAARIFQPGDLIMEVAGQEIKTVADLDAIVATHQRIWKLRFKRGDKVLELTVRG
jgi:hypothetical protein